MEFEGSADAVAALTEAALAVDWDMPKRLWFEAGRVRLVQRILSPTFAFRTLPNLGKLSITISIMLSLFALRMYASDAFSNYPILLFIPGVIICAFLFDHGNGIIAAFIASIMSIVVCYHDDSLQDSWVGLIVGFVLFIVMAVSIEALQEATHSLSVQREALLKADAEKDVLIRETAHRVRNDLATLSSMVRLQSRGMTGEGRAAMDTVAHRLAVLVSLHQRLAYEPGSKRGSINAEEFLGDLINEIRVTMIGIKPIQIDDQIGRHVIAHQTGIALGLIMNEALTNAAKYAFVGKAKGEIRVIFRRVGNSYKLSITDDGHNTGVIQGTGLGTRLMESMTAQIDGEITIDRTKGTRVCVVFPVEPVTPQA